MPPRVPHGVVVAVLDRFVLDESAQVLLPDNISPNPQEAAEARVKDPLWFLARQWETGEFEAENGGRPVHVDLEWESFPVETISIGEESKPLNPDVPLDSLVENEAADGSALAWDTARLEYRFGLQAGLWDFEAAEYEGRELDWHHFQAKQSTRRRAGTVSRARVVPTTLHVERMPHPRWWRFEESGVTSIDPALDPEPNVLSMLLNEYLYLDANNWFVVPLEHRVGHLRHMLSVRAIDTFGVTTNVTPLGADEGGDAWALFQVDGLGKSGDAGAFLFLPNVGTTIVEGDLLEEVRFIRDEEANLVWAVEESVFDVTKGERVNRADEQRPPKPLRITPAGDLASTPRYQLSTPLGPHWIPYVPALLQPSNPASSQIILRRGRTDPAATGSNRQYHGRLVGESWRLQEEEIPRVGLRVQRLRRSARDCNGGVHVWVGRRKDTGQREATAGLEFDFLEPEVGE